MQTKLTIGAILFVGLLIGGAIIFTGSQNETKKSVIDSVPRAEVKNENGRAVIEGGIQYVDITARGGYTPRVTKAEAGIPTRIRMRTENTYDCSMALVIPDLGYQAYLPQSGVTEIDVPVEKAQGTLRGLCSMAMYHFQIDFE